MDAPTPLLAGRTAVVTGAGAGIGKGIALGFAAFGARVAILEIEAESGERTAAAVRACGVDALALTIDVRDGEAVLRAMTTAGDVLGPIDVLVNNVGGTFTAAFV